MKIREDKKIPIKYWDIIHWDAASFLTNHDRYNSRLYYNKIKSNLFIDIILLFRGILGGIFRFMQEIINALFQNYSHNNNNNILGNQQYILLITNGTIKYASEEDDIIATCNKKGIILLIIYPGKSVNIIHKDQSKILCSIFRPIDYVRPIIEWVFKGINKSHYLFSREKKLRSLFIASIPLIRNYFVNFALAKRIFSIHGLPRAVLSLSSFTCASVAIVDYMKSKGVFTASIRTQSTTFALEHLSINTDVLFCKSLHERDVYNKLFKGKGPRLVDACLMSIPKAYSNQPISLPDEYVLVLGTIGEDYQDHRNINERLFGVAGLGKLPIVFKGHNLAEDFDNVWFVKEGVNSNQVMRIKNIKYNRVLIDNATLIVSTNSTMLYYALLINKPIIIVQIHMDKLLSDEFQHAPIIRIDKKKYIKDIKIDLTELKNICETTKVWFNNNYCIEKGSEYIVNYLLEKKHFKCV